MTTNEIKTELNRAREAERAYRLARDKANAYKQLLMYGKAVRYENDSGTHERKGNPVENAYCCLADYDAEADRLFRELVCLRKYTEEIIAKVPDLTQREVLTRRYIIGQRWEDIAECMHYNLKWIYKLHGRALEKLTIESD